MFGKWLKKKLLTPKTGQGGPKSPIEIILFLYIVEKQLRWPLKHGFGMGAQKILSPLG